MQTGVLNINLALIVYKNLSNVCPTWQSKFSISIGINQFVLRNVLQGQILGSKFVRVNVNWIVCVIHHHNRTLGCLEKLGNFSKFQKSARFNSINSEKVSNSFNTLNKCLNMPNSDSEKNGLHGAFKNQLSMTWSAFYLFYLFYFEISAHY